MPTSVPLTTKNPGDVLTSSLWNAQLKQNIDKLLNTGHRTLTVAQFAALTGLEGTKGTVAGDEVYLEVDATNGILWHLVYESTETTYKWRYLGGSPMVSYISTTENTTSTTYAALTTPGPAIALPRAGDYSIEISVTAAAPLSSAIGASSYMSFDIGGTGAVDADAIQTTAAVNSATTVGQSIYGAPKKTGLTAVTLTAKYRSTSGGSSFYLQRRMAVQPTRII